MDPQITGDMLAGPLVVAQRGIETAANNEFAAFKAQTEMEVLILKLSVRGLKQNNRFMKEQLEHFTRDFGTFKAKISKTETRLANLQRVVAKQADDSTERKKQTIAELEIITSDVNSIKQIVTELSRNATGADRNREPRAWCPTSSAESDPSRPGTSNTVAVRRRRCNSVGNECLGASGPIVPPLRNSFEKQMAEMLAKFGVVKFPQKLMMLKIWHEHYSAVLPPQQSILTKMSSFLTSLLGSLDSSGNSLEHNKELLRNAKRFLETPWQDMENLPFDELFEVVIDNIPDDEWLFFARSELELNETQIRNVKKTCQPTREQVFQLKRSLERTDNH